MAATHPSAADSSRSTFPHVVECGYRQIRVKSGADYPLWLVQCGPDAAVFCARRDWYRLGRCQEGLPKAAVAKLAHEVPWRRPDAEIQADVDNHWHPRMTKNLRLLDRYLQSAARQASSASADPRLIQAWKEFCQPLDPNKPRPADEETGNALGQYFCSRASAEQLVDSLARHLAAMDQPVVVVEPSCGHGHVIKRLLERPIRKIQRILGWDLDEASIAHCRRSISGVEWATGDFLQSKRHDHVDQDATVVIMGGPPYSAGAGHGSHMRRDLPIQFVQHALGEWKAAVVVFLLPERCRDIDYRLPSDIQTETVELVDSFFYFCGGRRVHQPSILQCFSRHPEH